MSLRDTAVRLLSDGLCTLPSGCWGYSGDLVDGGIPVSVEGVYESYRIRTLSLEVFCDVDLRGRVVRDTCSNPECINPLHLVVVSDE